MIDDLIKILENMEMALDNNKFLRLTALDRLQRQEEGDPFKVLIGTILSSRTRDEQTTQAVTKLFTKYKGLQDLADADVEDIKKTISSVGFYNIKAKRIKEVSDIINKQYHGKVPNNTKDLLELPGVGRKTANCVLVYGFKIPAIPVDTHVHRIFNRLGIVKTKDPKDTEEKLSKILDEKHWIKLNSIVVRYGQNICLPVKPLCNQCKLKENCNFYYEKKINTQS
ncbi:MAG: endonuclease III [Thermoproteota archaeon]|nr:endonuclease III [Thermoproteota archaeon]